MADTELKTLAREVIAFRKMLTRSLLRRINVESAMGTAMTYKVHRLFELADAALEQPERKP